MIIDWSDGALAETARRYGPDARVWKLVSDSEGCGCAMNGVPSFWLIDSPDPDDIGARSNGGLTVVYEKRHEVFFDDRMKVTFDPDKRAFKLASDGQIYSNRLRLEDRRKASR